MSESMNPGPVRVEVGRYRRLAQARERGLVVSALERAHWIEREKEEWVLFVEEPVREEVERELAAFEKEQEERPKGQETLIPTKTPKISLFIVAWILSGFFLAQQLAPESWERSGVADGKAILAGEWWRTITALTLHGDGPHLAANLASGLLFAMFLIPRLGTGLTWLAIVLSGALGNAINAWGYRGETHLSIGASTACFGALGLLVGIELIARWQEPHSRSLWQLILPIGAGLALLAFLGVGDEMKNIDYMAHCFGFLAGMAEGSVAQVVRFRERVTVRGQRIAASLAVLLVAVAWGMAMKP